MIVLMSWTRRIPAMTHDEYMDYWFNKHAPLVKSVPEFTRHIRKYAQYHLPDKSKVSASPFGALPDHDYDGVVAVWFDSYEEMKAAFEEPRYLEVIRPDELKFGNAAHSMTFIVEEFEILKA